MLIGNIMRTFIMLLSGRLPLGSLVEEGQLQQDAARTKQHVSCREQTAIVKDKVSSEGVLGRIEVRWEVFVEHLALSLLRTDIRM